MKVQFWEAWRDYVRETEQRFYEENKGYFSLDTYVEITALHDLSERDAKNYINSLSNYELMEEIAYHASKDQ